MYLIAGAITILFLLLFQCGEGTHQTVKESLPESREPGPSGISWSASHALAKVRPHDQVESQEVRLFAARNEFEPFQIVVRSDTDVEGVDIEISDFVGPDGVVLNKQNATIYLERYLNLNAPSSIESEAGEWPDPLIPRVDRYFGERRNAFPFRLTRQRNQPIWIELYIPQNTRPGLYLADVTISVGGTKEAIIPVSLTVWNFSLPSTSTLRTSFGFSGGGALQQHRGGYTSDADLRAISHLYSKAALLHRVSIHGGTFIPPPFSEKVGAAEINWTEYDREVGPFLDGTVFSEGEPLPGAKATSIDLRTHGGANTDERKILYWREWARHFAEKGWLDRLFYYVWDEPPVADYPQVAVRARLARLADSRIRTLVTTTLDATLEPVIDIWTPLINCTDSKPSFPAFCGTDVARALYDTALQQGKTLWWYQSCASHGCNGVGGEYFRGWPSYVIDSSPVANRIMPWISWKYRVTGELYYNMNEAFSRDGDPWNSVQLFGGNGDGTLFYPGRPDRIGGRTDIPIESIRLKLIREGLEDYEYLALLARRGLSDWADGQLAPLVRTAYDWERAPEILYDARRRLGERLNTASNPTGNRYKSPRIDSRNPLDC